MMVEKANCVWAPSGLVMHYSYLLEGNVPLVCQLSANDMHADHTLLAASYRLGYFIFQKEQK